MMKKLKEGEYKEKMENRCLFKAKSTFSDVWHTGMLATKEDKFYISNKAGSPFAYEISAETICQCTGLRDKTNTLIWEGDIVALPDEDEYFVISWDDGTARFCMENESMTCDFDNYWGWQVEVVGNKFDDTELLGVEG